MMMMMTEFMSFIPKINKNISSCVKYRFNSLTIHLLTLYVQDRIIQLKIKSIKNKKTQSRGMFIQYRFQGDCTLNHVTVYSCWFFYMCVNDEMLLWRVFFFFAWRRCCCCCDGASSPAERH